MAHATFFRFFRRWVARNMVRPVEMRYNPYTQTIESIDSMRGKNEKSDLTVRGQGAVLFSW